ncbi:MAG: carbonic anhydrase [Leadbetterella sp.]
MESYLKLLENNKEWASSIIDSDKEYFHELAKSQHPEFLWIGCADSRAPAELLTGTKPGQIFVHRNIANMVVHTDLNMLSVLQYAVENLKIKHILVVGHYNCGGIKGAMGNTDLGLVNKWVRNIKEVIVKHKKELEVIEDEQKRFDTLVEFNVIEQVKNVAETTIIQKAWKEENAPHIHGWVIDLNQGLINEVFEIKPNEFSKIDEIFRYDIK